MNTKIENKVKILKDILTEFLGDNINLACIKFFGLLISALCKVQTVCYEKLACSFDSTVRMDSSLRRIQRFMEEYVLDTDLIARFVFSLLPYKPPYRPLIDRTNWKFGSKDINILTLDIIYKGVGFSLFSHVIPKFGNSLPMERVDLINRFIQLFGRDSIECLMADREFVGHRWLEYLNKLGIEYYIYIRENFWVDLSLYPIKMTN